MRKAWESDLWQMIDFKEMLGCGKCFGRIMLSVTSRGLFITIAEQERKDGVNL